MATMGIIRVFCATTEGQTRRIAAQIAATIRQQGFESEVCTLTPSMPPIDWVGVRGVIVGASIHVGRHQRVALDFVRREAAHLNARPSAFFSVSLSAASRNPAEVDAARGLATRFVRDAGWEPRRVACIAGKLAYTQYGVVIPQVMRFIAWREGAPTDTSRDYEFTDWAAVRQFALDFASDAAGTAAVAEFRPAV